MMEQETKRKLIAWLIDNPWWNDIKDELPNDRAERAESELAKVREQNRWRKYPDENPEHKGTVIIYDRSRHIVDWWYDADAGFVDVDDNGYEFQFYPTHWRPLPSAPKGEE
jgi:hypothetical protein